MHGCLGLNIPRRAGTGCDFQRRSCHSGCLEFRAERVAPAVHYKLSLRVISDVWTDEDGGIEPARHSHCQHVDDIVVFFKGEPLLLCLTSLLRRDQEIRLHFDMESTTAAEHFITNVSVRKQVDSNP